MSVFCCLTFISDFKLLFIPIGLYLLYKYEKSKQNLHIKLGRRGPPPWPIIGNFKDLIKLGLHKMYREHLQKYGRIYPFYIGNIKSIVVSDEELLKQILVKEAKCFQDRMDLGFNGKSTEKMLTVLKGKDWERVRNLISPTFTSGKLQKMSPLISDGISLLEKRIAEYPVDKPIDFKECFGALTMDVIARTMFGMQIDSQTNPNNKFIIHAKKLFSLSAFNPFIFLFLIFPDLAKFIKKFIPKFEIFGKTTMKFFTDNLQKAIDERAKLTDEPREYNDFLALMLKARKEINEIDPESVHNFDSKSLTNQEIMAQSLVFLLAGYETTATALTYLAYFLAKNPNAQQEVYNEIIDSIETKGEITYETLKEMPILDAAVSETLRICPPLPRIERTCTQDVMLVASDNTKIEARKGDIFVIPLYAIHTDPSIWPDPDTFDLHRFDVNKKNIRPYSYMPFGMGPRNCIGMRFALLEAKWAIVNIIQKFEIVPCSETLDEIKFKRVGLSTPIKPILLKVVKRE